MGSLCLHMTISTWGALPAFDSCDQLLLRPCCVTTSLTCSYSSCSINHCTANHHVSRCNNCVASLPNQKRHSYGARFHRKSAPQWMEHLVEASLTMWPPLIYGVNVGKYSIHGAYEIDVEKSGSHAINNYTTWGWWGFHLYPTEKKHWDFWDGFLFFVYHINWLVVYLPLWKMMEFVSWGYYSQYEWKNIHKCSKPPVIINH